MFPRKTKTMDYLDILADAERKEFASPIKTVSTNLVVPSNETPPAEQNDVEIPNLPVLDDIDVDINTNEDIEKGIRVFNLC